MTTTLAPHPSAHVDRPADAGAAPPLFTKHAGPVAILAGATIVIAQLMMLPFDPKDHVPTSQSVVFQVAGAVYMVGFIALMFALIGAHGRQARQAGRFGVVALTAAMVGTMMLGGDLWFETFAIPWIADGAGAQEAFDTDPTVMLGLGAIASYLSFAIGWALFGIASFRASVFPRTIAVAIVIGGLIGFNALLAPFGIPLAIVVAALGLWMTSSRARV